MYITPVHGRCYSTGQGVLRKKSITHAPGCVGHQGRCLLPWFLDGLIGFNICSCSWRRFTTVTGETARAAKGRARGEPPDCAPISVPGCAGFLQLQVGVAREPPEPGRPGRLLGVSLIDALCLSHTGILDSQRQASAYHEPHCLCKQLKDCEPLLAAREWWEYSASPAKGQSCKRA